MRIGLTQAGLAERLGVSRHAVAGWEAGRSYPKADHLRHFIALGLQQRAPGDNKRGRLVVPDEIYIEAIRQGNFNPQEEVYLREVFFTRFSVCQRIHLLPIP